MRPYMTFKFNSHHHKNNSIHPTSAQEFHNLTLDYTKFFQIGNPSAQIPWSSKKILQLSRFNSLSVNFINFTVVFFDPRCLEPIQTYITFNKPSQTYWNYTYVVHTYIQLSWQNTLLSNLSIDLAFFGFASHFGETIKQHD